MHILDRRRHHHRNPLLHSPLEAAEEEVELATGVDYRDLEIRLLWAVPPWWESPEVRPSGSILTGPASAGGWTPPRYAWAPPSAVNVTWGRSTDVEHTVPVAEMAGLVLALRLIIRELVPRDILTAARAAPATYGSRKRAEIYSNNQAALRTLLAPKQAAGQYLVQELVDLIDQLNLVLDILFHWLAAHHGIAGNGLAGQKAKEAAGWRRGVTDGRCRPLAPVMMLNHPTRGPLDAWIKQHVKEQWGEAWRQSEHGRHLRRYLPGLTRHSFAIYNDLTPMERSVLAEMRTGKIGLARETIHHVLFGCTQYDDLRRATWTEGAPRDLTEALTEKQYVRRAARFMLNTGRLMYLAEATEPAWLEPIAPSSERLPTALAGDG
ncbi:hypothetical protein LV157_007910 [Aspergillus fumigatus]|nr:hypothetical protein LV157_007910 [Aspergillus fumigatus]